MLTSTLNSGGGGSDSSAPAAGGRSTRMSSEPVPASTVPPAAASSAARSIELEALGFIAALATRVEPSVENGRAFADGGRLADGGLFFAAEAPSDGCDMDTARLSGGSARPAATSRVAA